SVDKSTSTAVARNSDRASAYACHGEYVGTNDPDDIFVGMHRCLERARNGQGPSILELKTYRLQGHMLGDPMPYVSQEEKDAFIDCTVSYRAKLIAEEVLTEAQADDIVARAVANVTEAITFAEESPYPDVSAAFENQYVA
ncbi:MAG: TPP-dependent pyruvate/acetoin dehydrogenase alpha subunit, partial [Pseudoalteromonas tetraodonis]